MKRYSTVDAAANLAIEILEANHVSCDSDSIYRRVFSWYVHSDVTDPEILAACALTEKDWYPEATYEDMIAAKEYWFPQNPYENIFVGENESVQNDELWW